MYEWRSRAKRLSVYVSYCIPGVCLYLDQREKHSFSSHSNSEANGSNCNVVKVCAMQFRSDAHKLDMHIHWTKVAVAQRQDSFKWFEERKKIPLTPNRKKKMKGREKY